MGGEARFRRIDELAAIEAPDARRCAAGMLRQLDLDAQERADAVRVLSGWLRDPDEGVQTSAVQALADLASDDDDLRPAMAALLRRLGEIGSPAVQAHARRLSA